MISFRLGCSTHHLEDEALQEVAKWIATTGKMVFTVKEISMKEGHHIHSVSQFGRTPSTFRQQFIDKFPQYKGKDKRGIYSVKPEKIAQEQPEDYYSETELDKTLRYLCKGANKGTLPIIFQNTLLSEEQVRGYHMAFWQINEKITNRETPQKEAIKKREKPLTFVQEIAQKIMEKNDKEWDYDHHTKVVVFNQVMTSLGVKGKTLDAIIVRRLCYGVMNIIAPQAMKQHMWSQVFPDSYEYDT